MDSELTDLQQRAQLLQSQDLDRHQLIQDLLRSLDLASQKLQRTELDLETQQQARRDLQQKNQTLEAQLKSARKRPFAVVLIDADADAYKFQDHLLQGASIGGERAADLLAENIRNYLRTIETIPDRLDIIVKAFANVDKLAASLVRDGVVQDTNQLRCFCAGFNNRSPFFDFVDIGDGKERADQKIRENLQFYLEVPGCQHILLACCHDAGYAPFLGQYIADQSTAKRITLLEGAIVASPMKQLGTVQRVQFQAVFTTAVLSSTNGRHSPRSKGGYTYIVPSKQLEKLTTIIRNSKGQRIDSYLSVDESLMKQVKSYNLCHWLFLRGECKGCDRGKHSFRQLSDQEFDALWCFARQGSCWKEQKSICDDALCIYSHRGI